uniref:Uncharacterized protein n=1 Tax=Glossina pallidipes TaxID=7398 RepID=A0A1B0A0K3_GLOPL
MSESQRHKIADTTFRHQEPDATLDDTTPVLKQQPSLPQQQTPTESSTQVSPTSQRMPTYSTFNVVILCSSITTITITLQQLQLIRQQRR